HVAVFQAFARAREDRDIQSLLLRGGPDCARPRGDPETAEDTSAACRETNMGRAARRYRALLGLPYSSGSHYPQALPAGVARGTEEAFHEAPRYSREELEVLCFGRART